MRKIKYILLGLIISIGLASFVSCSDEDDVFHPWEPTEVIGIDVEGVDEGVLSLYTGGKHKLVVKYTPNDAANISDLKLKYQSSNENLFTVSENGEILAGDTEGDGLLHISVADNPELKFACAIVISDEFFPITEIVVNDQLKDYVAFVGQIIRIDDFVTVEPTNASIPKVSYKIFAGEEYASLVKEEETNKDLLTAITAGTVTVRIFADDGVSEVFKDIVVTIKEDAEGNMLNREGWTIKASHNAPKDTQTVGPHEFMLDGDVATIASFVKPGKKFGGVEVKKDDEVFFVVDMLKEQKFDLMYIKHRTGYDYLKLQGATFLGSNTGDENDFTRIMTNVIIDPKVKGQNVYINLGTEQSYRFIKVLFTAWDLKSGSTVGISEFNLGTISK